MTDKILFVDDDPAVLDGYRRGLLPEFQVDTAPSGEQGLAAIDRDGPYSVVVSDMRMPVMNGAQFLTRVRQSSPDTVRMLLTGYTDLDAAIDAVNEGNIFRFLKKPCKKETLGKALTTGLVQYRLVRAEKDLLENTLMGSIKVLTEVLSVASPEAFGRSLRILQIVRQLVRKFSLPSPWRFEVAAMLSQLGCVALDPELIEAAQVGGKMSPDDQARFMAHPKMASNLLAHIPRLEPIAWMVSQQLVTKTEGEVLDEKVPSASDIVFGAKILKLAVAMDNLTLTGLSHEEVIAKLSYRADEFSSELIEAAASVKSESDRMELRNSLISKLKVGMILEQEIRILTTGLLVVGAGQEVTSTLLIRLANLSARGAIEKEVRVMVPVDL